MQQLPPQHRASTHFLRGGDSKRVIEKDQLILCCPTLQPVPAAQLLEGPRWVLAGTSSSLFPRWPLAGDSHLWPFLESWTDMLTLGFLSVQSWIVHCSLIWTLITNTLWDRQQFYFYLFRKKTLHRTPLKSSVASFLKQKLFFLLSALLHRCLWHGWIKLNSVLFHPIEIRWFPNNLSCVFYGELQVLGLVFLRNE